MEGEGVITMLNTNIVTTVTTEGFRMINIFRTILETESVIAKLNMTMVATVTTEGFCTAMLKLPRSSIAEISVGCTSTEQIKFILSYRIIKRQWCIKMRHFYYPFNIERR